MNKEQEAIKTLLQNMTEEERIEIMASFDEKKKDNYNVAEIGDECRAKGCENKVTYNNRGSNTVLGLCDTHLNKLGKAI